MNLAGTTPVIVGVADIVNRSLKIEHAREPGLLMLDAVQEAVRDTGLPSAEALKLQSLIDSIDVVNTWTWTYSDLPEFLAQRLSVHKLQHKHTSPNGGNQPGKLFDDAARRISKTLSRVAVVTGGEALASLTACAAAKKIPPPGWTQGNVETVFSPTNIQLSDDTGGFHSIGAPIQVYPLFENGYRYHHAQSVQENHSESATMYGQFSKIAEHNPFAWNYGKCHTVKEIGTVSKKNRMICFPYPLLMNAFNTINLAGAVILTSIGFAKELGIPESKWIYPLGGAGTQDSSQFWNRPNYYSSPSISRSIDAALEVSGLAKADIDFYDFYSCFPIVPKIAAHYVGLSPLNPEKPITLLGGLTSFGGAGNNYSLHAITALTRLLRTGNGRNGLILANGGVMTYQHALCLSSIPRRNGSPYPNRNPLPDIISDIPIPPIVSSAEGEASIETYTVEFNRDGTPLRGYVVGRLKSNNHRFLANHGDAATLSRMASGREEIVGLTGRVWPDQNRRERNLFSITSNNAAKL